MNLSIFDEHLGGTIDLTYWGNQFNNRQMYIKVAGHLRKAQ
jgi:hypothetical protein